LIGVTLQLHVEQEVAPISEPVGQFRRVWVNWTATTGSWNNNAN